MSARFKPYPAYRDSGVEWLGAIPAHWEVAPVYARYEVALGKMLDAKKMTGDSGGRYLRNVDVQWDAVNTEDLPEMDFAPWERERYGLRSGDLLVCEGGEVGRTAIWDGEIEDCFYQKAIHRVRPRSPRDLPRCFYYLMYTLAKRGVFVAGGNPNTIDHLTAVQLRHYRLPFAPTKEQRAIAALLDRETARIDGLVAKKERLIELLLEKRTALITRAVTKGLDASVPMKDSGVEWLGEIPAHWEVKRLGQLLAERPRNGVSPAIGPDGTTPTFSTAAVNDGVVAIDGNVKHTTISSREAKPFLVFQGDTLLLRGSGSRSLVGRAGIVTGQPPEGCIYPDILIRLRPGPALTPWFLVNCLNSAAVRPQIESLAKTAAGIWKIAGEDVRCLAIPVPPHPDQRRLETEVSRILVKVDATVGRIREAINRLEELRTALISAAVTGKIDVRETVA